MKILSILLVFIMTGCTHLTSENHENGKLSILQGATNSKEVEFSIMAKTGRSLRFELRSAEGEVIVPVDQKFISRDFSPYGIHKVLFYRSPQEDLNLFVYDGTEIIDQRLIGKGQRETTKLKLAVTSNSNDHFAKHFKIWNELSLKNPEYLLMIGNNVYADRESKSSSHTVNEENIWKRYTEQRLRLPLFYQEKLIPTHALWDDHDYGHKQGNDSFTYKNESKEIFDTFYAQSMVEDDWSKSFGVGGVLALGDLRLYFLDARSFRSRYSDGTHLGLDQKSWFYERIKEDITPSLIIKGDQFFSDNIEQESYETQHPEEFKQFGEELRKIETPFIFLSGGKNMSQIMQFPRSLFGKPNYEITTGPMHSEIKSLENDNNPWRVVENKSHINFTVLENEIKDNHWFINLENVGENGELYYKRELAVYIKDLQDNLIEARKRRQGQRRYRRIKRR